MGSSSIQYTKYYIPDTNSKARESDIGDGVLVRAGRLRA